MSDFISKSVHSSRLLLYLEWLLLGMATLTLILTAEAHAAPIFSLIAIVTTAIFGVMGLRLPPQTLLYQTSYTLVGFGVILLPHLLDERIPLVPMLGVVAVIRSCRMMKMLGRLLTASLAFGIFLYSAFAQAPSISLTSSTFDLSSLPLPRPTCNLVTLRMLSFISSGLVVVFVLLLFGALRVDRQNQEKLAIAHHQLRQYALRIEDQATLQERNRIAREIHDSLGHLLTAQSIQLENTLLFLRSNPQKAETFLTQAQDLSAKALQEVRQSITALWSDPLQGQSLETAIAHLVQDFQRTAGIRPQLTIHLSQALSHELNIALYRIVQEALTNIYKHSEATQVTIQLDERTKAIYLLIADNGKGFHPDQNTTGFGLQGMRERSLALGGTLTLLSQPRAGCRITAVIPLSSVSYDSVAVSG